MGYSRHKATGVRQVWVKVGEGCDESWRLELSADLLLARCGYPRAIFGAEAVSPQPGQQPIASVGEQFLAQQHRRRRQCLQAQAKRCRGSTAAAASCHRPRLSVADTCLARRPPRAPERGAHTFNPITIGLEAITGLSDIASCHASLQPNCTVCGPRRAALRLAPARREPMAARASTGQERVGRRAGGGSWSE